eukprot:3515378-Pyramimonas_sp.AAC.1
MLVAVRTVLALILGRPACLHLLDAVALLGCSDHARHARAADACNARAQLARGLRELGTLCTDGGRSKLAMRLCAPAARR